MIFCLAGLCAVFAAVAASFRMSGFRRGAASWTGEMFYNRKFPESTEWGNGSKYSPAKTESSYSLP